MERGLRSSRLLKGDFMENISSFLSSLQVTAGIVSFFAGIQYLLLGLNLRQYHSLLSQLFPVITFLGAVLHTFSAFFYFMAARELEKTVLKPLFESEQNELDKAMLKRANRDAALGYRLFIYGIVPFVASSWMAIIPLLGLFWAITYLVIIIFLVLYVVFKT